MRVPNLSALFVLISMASSVAAGRAVTPPTGDLEQVLDHAREAACRDAWPAAGLSFTGRTRALGVEAGFELFFSATGSYRYAMDGPLARTSTWDGSSAWMHERRGPGRELDGEERDEWRLAQWLHSGYWVDPAAPLSLAIASESEDRVELSVACDNSTLTGTLTLDTKTWLPVQLERESEAGPLVFTFGEYRKVTGVPIAHLVVNTQAGIENRLTITAAGEAEGVSSSDCTLAVTAATDTRFDADAPAEIEVRQVRTGHLLVHPRVEGRDMGWFILDSGAGQFCIDPAVADELELPEFGAVPAVGIGGTVTASFRQGEHFALGPIEIEDTVYVELDLSFLEPAFGVPVAGICGYDLFARAVVELDLVGPHVSLHDPASYRLARGEWGELQLDDRLPCIPVRFEGDREGIFKIDTGDPGTVSFYGPAVEELGLLEGRTVSSGMTGGVGGAVPVKLGELEWIEIAGRRFDAVNASFALGAPGAFDDKGVVGSLGGALLKPFRLVFDYSGERIALVQREK